MKARIIRHNVRDLGPDLESRTEYADGSVGYGGRSEVTLTFVVTGDIGATHEFLQSMKKGAAIQSIQVEAAGLPSSLRKARMYVFDE